MTKLTLMDDYVRRGMLNYPSLFPNRLRVLCQTFLVLGNGVEWKKNGTLSVTDYRSKEMRYDDPEEGVARYLDMRAEDPEGFVRLRDRAYERAERNNEVYRKRSENIIELATTKIPEDFIFNYDEDAGMVHYRECIRNNVPNEWGNYGGHYEEAARVLDLVRGDYLTINKMPKRVEKSFFDGAIEMLDVVIRSTPSEPEDVVIGIKEFRDVLHTRHKTYQGPLVEV